MEEKVKGKYIPFLIVIDALDKCSRPETHKNFLSILKESLPLFVKIFVISHPEDDIRNILCDLYHREIKLDEDGNIKDLYIYAQIELKKSKVSIAKNLSLLLLN